MIPELRRRFNEGYTAEKYAAMLARLAKETGTQVEFRVAETPVFLPPTLLHEMADGGKALTKELLADPVYLAAARQAIPAGYKVANETAHPHFLTADFALVRGPEENLVPRLVEIQAFPSVYAYQAVLGTAYRDAFQLPESLGWFLGGIAESEYWSVLAQTILAGHDPKNVVLTEVDPLHQKTLPDFNLTARRLGIAVVDIASLKSVGDRLFYSDAAGRLVPIHRIYNRAIADELIARNIQLPFDLSRPWEVEWAGHPNWYFLISKFSIPWLSSPHRRLAVVPPAVFLEDFLEGAGRAQLQEAGVVLPDEQGLDTPLAELLLKPLFSFAGKGIQFEPTRRQLLSIPKEQRAGYLLQQRMQFVPTVETPHGLTQAEVRILYLWPDGGTLTPVLSLVRLGRGKMMGVDHNKDQAWVGGSAAFFPRETA